MVNKNVIFANFDGYDFYVLYTFVSLRSYNIFAFVPIVSMMFNCSRCYSKYTANVGRVLGHSNW